MGGAVTGAPGIFGGGGGVTGTLIAGGGGGGKNPATGPAVLAPRALGRATGWVVGTAGGVGLVDSSWIMSWAIPSKSSLELKVKKNLNRLAGRHRY